MKLKIFVVLLTIFGFASVYYSDNGLLPYPDAEFADAATFPVLKVIDAATVEIHYEGNPTVVKLIGVKVPETMHPDNPNETARAAALAFLHNLLLGESVYLHFEGDAPEQAYLYRAPDELFVNLEVVRQGYAQVNAQATFKHLELLALAFLHNLLLGESVYLHFEGDAPEQAYLYRAPDELFVNLEVVRQGYAQVNAQATFKHLELFVHYEERARTAEKGLWAPTSKLQVVQGILPDDDTQVYVTPSGEKFHRENCVVLKRSKRKSAIRLGVAKQTHMPCSFCKPLESLKKPLDN